MAVTVEALAADSRVARDLLAEYFADREITSVGGYQPKPADPSTLAPPHGAFLVARDDNGAAIGCGALRSLEAARFEVKHLYVAPAGRGRGTGAALLAALEAEAVRLGASEVVLDTNRALAAANALYASRGYVEIESYNDNPNATSWFLKELE